MLEWDFSWQADVLFREAGHCRPRAGEVVEIELSGAEKLVAMYVDAKDAWAELRKTITERMLRSPRGTLVYSITE